MKKNLILCLSILSSVVSGCDNQSNSIETPSTSNSELPSEIEKEISTIEVKNYSEKINYLADYNDSGIRVKVTYSDESNAVYGPNQLDIDYSNFTTKKLGKQNIGIKVKNTDISTNIEVEVVPSDSFNILMIGNSFTDDTVQWVNEICADLGINVKIANLFIGSSTLQQHCDNLTNDNAYYDFRTYNEQTKRWQAQAQTTIKTAMNSYDWDFVSLQQSSGTSGLANSYDCLPTIIDEVKKLKEDVRFVWNFTWAYQQDTTREEFFTNYNSDQKTMYSAIVNCLKEKVVVNEVIELIVPNGTAIQNARTSFIGDNLTRDGYHLSFDLGRYIAGLSLVATMTAQDISKVAYAPEGVTPAQQKVAIESVINALASPYSVTESQYKTEG